MFITTWPLPEVTLFGNLLLWGILPILVISMVSTICWHYYKKARMSSVGVDNNELTIPMSIENPVIVSRGAYVYFDHSNLIKDYQDKIHYQHARFAALQHDFRKLEKKYIQALGTTSLQLNPADFSTDEFEHFYHTEKAILLDRLTELEKIYCEQIGQNATTAEPIHNLPTAQG